MDRKGEIISEERGYELMARLCSRKECAPFDVIRKLRGMGLAEPVINRITARLKSERYLDEARFIRGYIHDKLHFNQWGKRKIILNLKQKHLPDEVIERVFSEFSPDSVSQSLLPLLEKKWKSVKGGSDYEKRGKLIRYALGKGFSMDEVMQSMSRMAAGEIIDETE